MEYCGIDLAKLDKYNPKIKVCSGYDFYSSITYKELIEKNKHLAFYKVIENKYKFLTKQEIGSLIRWLYRGLSLEKATNKVIKDHKKAQSYIRNPKSRSSFH